MHLFKDPSETTRAFRQSGLIPQFTRFSASVAAGFFSEVGSDLLFLRSGVEPIRGGKWVWRIFRETVEKCHSLELNIMSWCRIFAMSWGAKMCKDVRRCAHCDVTYELHVFVLAAVFGRLWGSNSRLAWWQNPRRWLTPWSIHRRSWTFVSISPHCCAFAKLNILYICLLEVDLCEFAVVLLAFLVAGCRLLSGDVSLTLLEVGSLGGLVAAAWLLPAEKVNVKGSWTLKELAAFLCTKAT